MKQYMLYLIVTVSAVLSVIFMMDYENEIEELKLDLQQQTDSLNSTIDSLMLEIDTLTWENQIWDFNTTHNEVHLLSAIIHVESSNNDSAYCASEDAVGCLQIRKCMVDDVNRILRRQGEIHRYSYDDRWLRSRSIKMFDIYCKHYGLTTAEEIARCWNGGPRGIDNPNTLGYWGKVKSELNS